MHSGFGLLRNKEIIGILDGDKRFGKYIDIMDDYDDEKRIEVCMPYLSGSNICSIAETFGYSQITIDGRSRWEYFKELLNCCIKDHKMSELLTYIFEKDKFMDQLKGLSPDQIEGAHNRLVKEIIEQINSVLYFGDNELCIVGKNYVIRKIGETVTVKAPSVKIIDREYIKSLAKRANQDIEDGNYDSAITKARTILEETFFYVIEKKGQAPSEKGDINTLYKQVKDLYNMHTDKDLDIRINTLLSGLEKIISAIGQMRNKESDSHGVGSKRIGIEDHHTRLFVNADIIMADFILSIYLNTIK